MPISGPPFDKPVRFKSLLRTGLDARPNELALVSAEMSWTWAELEAATDRYAANLLGLGLQPGDRVASLMPNRTALILHYIACLKARLAAVPLNYRYMPPEIDHALSVSEALVLFHHVERDDDVLASKFASKLPLGTIGYKSTDGRSPTFEQLVDAQPSSPDLPTIDLQDPAIIFFTSGSTGQPKGVTHTHDTLGWLIGALAANFELTADDVVLPGSSCSHIAGVQMALIGLAVGARVELALTLDGDELLSLLRTAHPTVMLMLPAALMSLVRDHNATRDDFASLRLCVSGGDKVAAELENEFHQKTGMEIHEVYGMTEMGLSHGNRPHGRNKLGSIGVTFDGYTMSVRDEAASEVATDETGKLWIESRANMARYWNRPDATAETIVDGWLDTGDMVSVDKDEYVWFRGRKKQIIVHDGSNICPQEIEDVLLEHPAVEAAGVVGVHDLVHGENVYAYITVKEDAKVPKSQELVQFARTKVGYKAPEQVIPTAEMPLNATGKVDRIKLKQMAEQRVHGGA